MYDTRLLGTVTKLFIAVQNAGSPDEAMASAAYYAIGEVARKNRLPLPDDPADGEKDEDEIKDPTNPCKLI